MSSTPTSSSTRPTGTGQSSSPTMTSTPSTSFSLSSTFSEPSPTSTSSRGGGGGGGGGNGGLGNNNNGGGIASSASLYLYTFLATLVLLLSVSAAIILRSLILRRRHRRMVEEAIRNGTWVPPSPGGSGGFGLGGLRTGRVDLSRKPHMWEAYLGSEKEKEYNPSSLQRPTTHTEWDWDSIQPFSASYVTGSSSAAATAGSSQPSDGTSSDNNNTNNNNASSSVPRFTSAPLAFSRRMVMRFLSPGSEQARPYPMAPRSANPSSSAASLPPAAADGDGGNGDGSSLSSAAKKVRVAVLIAMPHPSDNNHETKSETPSPVPGASSSSSSSSSSASARGTTSSSITPGSSGNTGEEEKDLPQIEFGIAVLEVRESLSHEDNDVVGGGVGVNDATVTGGKNVRRSTASVSVEGV